MGIASRASWGAKHRNGFGTRPVGRLEKYAHHTVTSHLSENATVAQERAQMRVIESIGQQRFKVGISYNFVIFPSGRIYEGASVNRLAAHSGSGRNTRGVGFCFAGNYETNKFGTKALRAAVWLLQEGVRRKWWGDPALTEGHRDFRATSCPGRFMYSEINTINHMGRGGKSAPEPPKATAPKKPAPKKSSSTYTGSSIVEYLNSIGQSSTFSARARLAAQHGISGYRGTAAQNRRLLRLLRSGSTPSKSTSKSSGYTGDSIVAYLKSVGQNSSFSHRATLARRHGISNYRGTATQNTRLLNILRGGGTSSSGRKSIATVAQEIIDGRGGWGNNPQRAQRLRSAGYNPSAVQSEVNRRLR